MEYTKVLTGVMALAGKNDKAGKKGNIEEIEEMGKAAEGTGVPEKPKDAKKSWFLADVPVYLIILILILGLVGGYAMSLLLQPQAPTTPIGPGDEEKTIKVELVYSDDCGFCRKSNTILDVFDAKQIPYKVEEVEASSPKGLQLISDFGINSVPTALVSEKALEFYSTEKRAMDESFVLKDGKYIVPELILDQDSLYAKMYLDTSACNDSNKVVVELFDDPYSELGIVETKTINGELAGLEGKIDLRYNYIEWNVNSLADDFPFRLESLPAKYLRCAAGLGKFAEYNDALKGAYCNIIGVEPEATQEELDTCNLSKHYGNGARLVPAARRPAGACGVG